MRKLIVLIFTVMVVTAHGQGVLERKVKATETLETGVSLVYRNYDIPLLDVSYHEFSSDSVTWRKNYQNGDCYVRFANTVDNSVTKHPSWWVYNFCQGTTSGLDTIIVDYGATKDTLTAGNYTVTMSIPDTITGSTANQMTSGGHTHAIQIYLNDNEDVNASPSDGQVLKYNAISGKWQAANDIFLSGSGGGLRVIEEDGTPDVANVSELRIPNGRLINNGSGSVSLVLSIAPSGGENNYWRAGVQTSVAGTNTIAFSSALPAADYTVVSSYAVLSDSTRQSLLWGNRTVSGFDVYSVIDSGVPIYYTAIRDVDSLLAVTAEIGKVKASAVDPVYGYLANKVDDSTIVVSNYQLHSIADLNDVVLNGAVTDSTLYVGGIGFDTTPVRKPYAKGQMYWNDTDGTVDLELGESEVTMQLGQELVIKVYNDTGGTISNGNVVYKSGRQGNIPKVAKARADAAATSEVLGIATEDILTGNYGYITTFGQVRGLNMVGYTVNATLYLSASTAGAFTQTPPVYPNYIIAIGNVGVNTGNGTVDVMVKIDPHNHVVINDLGVVDTLKTSTLIAAKGYVGTSTNNTSFTTDGTLIMSGNATVWNDILPMAVDVAGGASAPSFTAYNGNLRAYEFVGAATLKDLHAGFQLPHSYKEGSDIGLHLHLYVPNDVTGGTIKFYVEYTWANFNQTGTITPTLTSGTIVRTAGAGINNNIMLSFPAITGTGKTISSILMVRIYRDPTDVADTFASSVWLKGLDLHIEQDQIGSNTETTK